MLRTFLSHRRKGAVTSIVAVAVTVPMSLALSGAFAASSSPIKTAVLRQEAAQHLIKIGEARFMTWPAQLALHYQATGDRQLSPLSLSGDLAQPAAGGSQVAEPRVESENLPNVRVNNPGEDHQLGQTTQSETAIAVSGSHVAVGFNDSSITGLFLTAGSNLNGYAFSTDGGKTFTDGGALPDAPGTVNFGDPWMGSDRTGAMYNSTLVANFFTGALQVGVAKSTDGGKTWGTPVPVFQPPSTLFESGDKDALAVGPDPAVATRDDLYVSYDDFAFDTVTNTAFNGLPVAHSTDGGKTWKLVYADKIIQGNTGCSFAQYIGATPVVAADGTLYVTAEKISVNDPNCTGTAPTVFSEWFFKSTDGGNTFGPGVKIADVTSAEANGLLFLGPGRYARTIEFPSPALFGGKIFVAWNDGGKGGHSHIRLATSADGGATWTNSFVTGGTGDEIQPSLSADSSGLRLLYYHRHPDNTIDVFAGTSTNGTTFTTRRVTSVPFRGSLTVPQFDPIIAFGYMGDYIANVTAAGHQYFAWGDNRDTVKDFLFPNGRNDPDVFFARN
jgi:hypothetical protein